MPSIVKPLAVLLAAAIISVASGSAAHAQGQDSGSTFRIRQGQNEMALFERYTTVIEHTANIRQVFDFDPEVIKVDTVPQNPRQVRVSALQTGVTTVSIVDEFGEKFSVEVLVRGDVRHLESYIRRLYPDDTIHVEEIKGAVRLDGWVTRPEHIEEIEAIAEQFYPEVMNHMKTGDVQQVLLKCTVMEVQRSKFRKMGMNFNLIKPGGYLISTPGPITPIQNLTSTGAGTTATFAGFADSTISYGFTNQNGVFQGFLQALREEGLLKLHATPMLVTHNGRPANLLNGGETPILIPSGLGTTAVEFKEFGVQLDAVPHILGNGRVRLEIETAIRDRDFSNAVTVGGVTVPAFIVRRANTQVEMNFGEALVIAGLISQREEAATSKVPFLGELPYIGSAFNRKQYNEAETELIVIVTPEKVSPMPSGQMLPGGPGKFTDTPTDRELVMHHLLEVPSFGEACDQCLDGGVTGSCPPGGFGASGVRVGDDCVKTNSEKASPLIRPQDTGTAAVGGKATPASHSSGTASGKPVKPAVRRSSGSGLISPTLR